MILCFIDDAGPLKSFIVKTARSDDDNLPNDDDSNDATIDDRLLYNSSRNNNLSGRRPSSIQKTEEKSVNAQIVEETTFVKTF